MIDLKDFAARPEFYAENNRRRGATSISIQVLQDLLQSFSDIQQKTEAQRALQNAHAEAVAKASPDERPALIEKGQALKQEAKGLEDQLAALEMQLEVEAKRYPNVLREDVPEGKSEEDNVVLREVGKPPVFDFEAKDHVSLGEALSCFDIERAGKVSGSRFVYVMGDAVLLEFALIQYALQTLMPEGFIPVLPPHIISTKAMAAMGYLEHGGEEEIYHLKNDEAVLIGTSEQAIGPLHGDEVLSEQQLPLRYMGFSPCYRREAGSHGRDVRGILRMHQFDKIEMFSFTTPEESDREHELLLSLEEKLMQGLGLPYRVMKLCSTDIGRPSARTYDIETWMPGQGKYRETHSTSNTTDFQTRRLKIRYKRSEDGKNALAHALNGTAFAIGRILIAILENNQQKDGSVVIPEVLRPWMGGREVMGKK